MLLPPIAIARRLAATALLQKSSFTVYLDKAKRCSVVALATAAWVYCLAAPAVRAAPGSAKVGASRPAKPLGTRTAAFHSMELSYRVVDGMAVHAGDMVLGPVDSLRSVPASSRVPALKIPAGPARRDSSSRPTLYRWPYGRIPYVIDSDISAKQRQDIVEAIAEWNDKTVISLVQRGTQADYIRFKRVPSGDCRADVGMIGDEQGIYLPPSGCSRGSVAHEIGHAVGLFHEHQRIDRNQYVTVLDENLDKSRAAAYRDVHPGSGPYDYASLMHYDLASNSSNGGFVMETVPPGMAVSGGRWGAGGMDARLSQGDIDGVAKFYERPPKATSITTNPPGLDVVIDGVRVKTPAQLAWKANTSHVLEAPSPQRGGATRFLFGRWSDGGERVRTVTITPDATWFEANFIVQHRVRADARPPGSGSVELDPPSPDGFYTARTPVRAVATADPGSGHKFWRWGGVLWGQHGASSNPAALHVNQPRIVFQALFTNRPLFRINASVEPFLVSVDGNLRFAPTALRVEPSRPEVEIQVDALQRLPIWGKGRYRFEGWSDGGPASRRIVLPAEGGALTAKVVSEFPLSTTVERAGSGSVGVDPLSDDGHYRDGSVVRLSAVPAQGWDFVGWSGDAHGDDPVIEIEIDRPKHVEPVYSRSREVQTGMPGSVVLPPMGSASVARDRVARFRVQPTPGATEISIGFASSTPGVDVDVFVNAGTELLRWEYAKDGRTPVYLADFHLESAGRFERIVITPDSQPSLDPRTTYYVTLVPAAGSGRIRGTLHADIRGAEPRPSSGASPRAFTFVSSPGWDPAPQVVRVSNGGASPLQYRIDSDRPWLAALPSTGVVPPGGSEDVTVSVTGAGIAPDTHRGRLAIVESGDGAGDPLEPLTVPVWFVVTPEEASAL